jgi:hypothetical protein
MAVCDILDLCPYVIRNPSNPDEVLFWDTSNPKIVVTIKLDSWLNFVDDMKTGKYDNL